MVQVLERPEHECEEYVSECCGAGGIEMTDICAKCWEHTGFECVECGKVMEGEIW